MYKYLKELQISDVIYPNEIYSPRGDVPTKFTYKSDSIIRYVSIDKMPDVYLRKMEYDCLKLTKLYNSLDDINVIHLYQILLRIYKRQHRQKDINDTIEIATFILNHKFADADLSKIILYWKRLYGYLPTPLQT